MKISPYLFISFISIVVASSLLQTDLVILHYSRCFEIYLQQVNRINRNFENAVRACNDEDNINRSPPQQLNLEIEERKYRNTSREACSRLSTCNLISDVIGFFNCYSENAEENIKKFAVMQLNASAVVIELNDQYDKEEKEILRCHLAAKRTYFLDSSDAYKEHENCLNGFYTECDTPAYKVIF